MILFNRMKLERVTDWHTVKYKEFLDVWSPLILYLNESSWPQTFRIIFKMFGAVGYTEICNWMPTQSNGIGSFESPGRVFGRTGSIVRLRWFPHRTSSVRGGGGVKDTGGPLVSIVTLWLFLVWVSHQLTHRCNWTIHLLAIHICTVF